MRMDLIAAKLSNESKKRDISMNPNEREYIFYIDIETDSIMYLREGSLYPFGIHIDGPYIRAGELVTSFENQRKEWGRFPYSGSPATLEELELPTITITVRAE